VKTRRRKTKATLISASTSNPAAGAMAMLAVARPVSVPKTDATAAWRLDPKMKKMKRQATKNPEAGPEGAALLSMPKRAAKAIRTVEFRPSVAFALSRDREV
jgi:hypothetical protein